MRPYLIFKRFYDVLFALILLILLSPIMIVAALAIKIEDSSGPVLFRQTRPGKDEKHFKVNKFRTMKVNTEKEGKSFSDHERLTRVGKVLRKLSIDELPQLFNILAGNMSFIGPRPLLLKYLPYYTQQERKRHLVRPGITGLAQIKGRNMADWEKRFENDIFYVENLSFRLDVKIALMTIIKILKREDVDLHHLPDLDDYRK